MREAWLYEKLENGRVHCHLCAHRCLIADGKKGICYVRENQGGTLYTLTYGQLLAQNIDPIEKKPLFHFYPGSTALSIATAGCNFRCSFCQNADISQISREQGYVPGRDTAPEAIVGAAQRGGCQSIAYTYTEPTMFFEYNYEIGQLAHAQGIANVYVSNGFMTPEMLDMTTSPTEPPLIDAANIDLKAFRDAFYRHECGAALQPVLDSLIMMKKRGVWVEVTTLVIPEKNDAKEELRDIAQFIATELSVETPWHVSRFHPTYKLTDRGATPVRTLQRAREIGLEAGLRYVYIGNVPGDGEDTYCPQCGRKVIDRIGFTVLRHEAQGGPANIAARPLPGLDYNPKKDTMYHEFDAVRVQQLLGITPQDTPRGLILHGTYNMPQHAQRWRDRLANARVAAKVFNLVIGEYQGATLWYAPVLGGPMAAFMAHAAAVIGVQSIVQIGSFGATRRGLEEGELLLVTGAERGEAASDWYLPKNVPARPDERLSDCLRTLLRGRGLTWHEGPVFTTPAFMAETWADILRWESEGYAGVEMEAATTFAIAQHFGVPAACLLFLLDNLIEERHLLHHTELVRERIQQSRALIEEMALKVILSFP